MDENAAQVKYTLIPMLNYHKTKDIQFLEKPSPNLLSDQSISLYPIFVWLKEQVSVGRGTDFPFQVYGVLGLKKSGIFFHSKPTSGAKIHS